MTARRSVEILGVRVDDVTAGEALFTLYTEDPQRLAPALAELDGAWTVGRPPPTRRCRKRPAGA